MRITLSESEFEEILLLAQSNNKDTLVSRLLEEEVKAKVAKSSENLKEGAKQATKLREYRCKVRIAIALTRVNDSFKKPNYSKIARVSETSINTVKKYYEEIKELFFIPNFSHLHAKGFYYLEYKDYYIFHALNAGGYDLYHKYKKMGLSGKKLYTNPEYIKKNNTRKKELLKLLNDLGFQKMVDDYILRFEEQKKNTAKYFK